MTKPESDNNDGTPARQQVYLLFGLRWVLLLLGFPETIGFKTGMLNRGKAISYKNGASGQIRTVDRRFTKPLLYP